MLLFQITWAGAERISRLRHMCKQRREWAGSIDVHLTVRGNRVINRVLNVEPVVLNDAVTVYVMALSACQLAISHSILVSDPMIDYVVLGFLRCFLT